MVIESPAAAVGCVPAATTPVKLFAMAVDEWSAKTMLPPPAPVTVPALAVSVVVELPLTEAVFLNIKVPPTGPLPASAKTPRGLAPDTNGASLTMPARVKGGGRWSTTTAWARRFAWLPSTCAYRLRAAGETLPEWHYLICGDREAVHRAGQSVRGWTVAEGEAGDLEWHVIDDDL